MGDCDLTPENPDPKTDPIPETNSKANQTEHNPDQIALEASSSSSVAPPSIEMAISLPIEGVDPSPDSKPSWFSPKRLLIIFCVINMLNYVDRGAIASNGVNGSIKTCTESGICTSGSGIQAATFTVANLVVWLLASHANQ